MTLKVIKPGLLTTVQDLGRSGYQQYGVSAGGAMDTFALRAANLLVANEPDAAALEMTLQGPVLELEKDAWIAVCGADMGAKVNEENLPLWRPVFVKAGTRLSFGAARLGCRAYLAVSGGFKVPEVLGGRGTYLRAQFGGFAGRPLMEGDRLETGDSILAPVKMDRDRPYDACRWYVSPHIFPAYGTDPIVRVVKGPEYEWFRPDSREMLLKERYRIRPESDRMGYRLDGPALEYDTDAVMLSEAVTAGTIQVPPDGKPVVLMADRQTTGGYARIATVIQVDLPVLAQLKPGDSLEFQLVSREEAERLYIAYEAEMSGLKLGILTKWREMNDAG